MSKHKNSSKTKQFLSSTGTTQPEFHSNLRFNAQNK